MRRHALAIVVLGFVAATSSVLAQRRTSPTPPAASEAAAPERIEPLDEGPITTRHQITVAGRALTYTARAGLLPIRGNETGEIRGRMYFTAYVLDRQAGGAPRPLTFLWNGG